jgi:ribosomal protein S18 acetylase RimI-like enzyme
MGARARERHVRPATAGDRARVRELLEQTYREHARLAPDFFAAAAADPSVGDERVELVLVAAVGQKVVGLVRARLYDTPPDPGLVGRRRLHVTEIVIEPAERRRGHGRALLEAACAWGKVRGARDVVLTLWSGNGEAEQFYAALGFRCINRVLAQPL